MGRRGRFGKYGEQKRIQRLRRSGWLDANTPVHVEKIAKDKRSYKQRIAIRHQVSVRPTEPGDSAFIRDLSATAFNCYGPYEDLLFSWFESGVASVYTAFAGSYCVGFAMLGWFREANFLSDTAEVLAIAVVPDRRRGGVGRLLMEEIERAARSHYAKVLLLHTAVENQPAKALFRKCGFKKGQVKRGFYPAGQDAIAMFKVLKRARFIRPALTKHSSFLLPHSSSLVE